MSEPVREDSEVLSSEQSERAVPVQQPRFLLAGESDVR
jgi:hypothetical protein